MHMRPNNIPNTLMNVVSTNILQTYQQTLQCSLSEFPGSVHLSFACALLACPIS